MVGIQFRDPTNRPSLRSGIKKSVNRPRDLAGGSQGGLGHKLSTPTPERGGLCCAGTPSPASSHRAPPRGCSLQGLGDPIEMGRVGAFRPARPGWTPTRPCPLLAPGSGPFAKGSSGSGPGNPKPGPRYLRRLQPVAGLGSSPRGRTLARRPAPGPRKNAGANSSPCGPPSPGLPGNEPLGSQLGGASTWVTRIPLGSTLHVFSKSNGFWSRELRVHCYPCHLSAVGFWRPWHGWGGPQQGRAERPHSPWHAVHLQEREAQRQVTGGRL